jgi:hypothetical protein
MERDADCRGTCAEPVNHKVLTCVEFRAVSDVFHILTPHPPLNTASVSSPVPKAGGTHSPGGEGVGGQYFKILWKTPDIGLASYSIISLRCYLYIFAV